MPDVPASLGALRQVPYMGVIHVVAEAARLGYRNGHPEWSNLGQGQPEVGPIPGAPPRIEAVELEPDDHAYGPLEGLPELRERVAEHYNRLYRAGKGSRYAARNVAIAQGGRLALTRAMAALGRVHVGYQVPDYTAYQDMLETHLARIMASPIGADAARGFELEPAAVERAVEERGLQAFLMSNPCNPTGSILAGADLARLVDLARSRGITLLLDEFYSHFNYAGDEPISAAAHVDDVDREPVVLFDGLTKSFRYPGWRVGWVVGPPEMVETMARTASAIDGGPSRIAQRAALRALEPAQADGETSALRACFRTKRDVMVDRLRALGVRVAVPAGTFYCWGDLSELPRPFDDAETFFRRALGHRVLTVPGHHFDVDPGHFRRGPSPWRRWMRFSFGPPLEQVVAGLDRLGEMLGSV